MAGKRVAQKAVDWVRLGKNIPAAASAEFGAFRARHETVKGSLSQTVEKPAAVDFALYSSTIKNKALVEKFQAAYAKVQVPYPVDTESVNILAEEKEIESEIVATSKVKKEKIAKLEAEIAKIKAQRPFEEMTTLEYMDDNPEVKKQADREIEQIGWR